MQQFLTAITFFVTLTTFFGCSSNIELEDVQEDLKTVNEVRLYTVTGESHGMVILQEVSTKEGLKYRLRFSEFSFSSCSGTLTATLSGGSNSASVTITDTAAASVVDISGRVDPVSATEIMIKCDSTTVGRGTSDSFISSGEAFIKGGSFKDVGTHKTSGSMKIYRESAFDTAGKPTAKYVLRFENIKVDVGPDVQLYFTPSSGKENINESGTLRVPLDGTEKGTFSKSGDFNQDAPSDFDPSRYNGVLVWCRQAGVPFGILEFTEVSSSSGGSFLKGGSFQDAGTHKTSGNMKIYSESHIGDNGAASTKYVLRFENIVVDEGPDVALYFTPSAGRMDINEAGTYVVTIDGREKGTFSKAGNFNQEMPTNFDATKFNGVLVWCRQVGVPFGILEFTEFP